MSETQSETENEVVKGKGRQKQSEKQSERQSESCDDGSGGDESERKENEALQCLQLQLLL